MNEMIVRMGRVVEYIHHFDCEHSDSHHPHEWTDENENHYCYSVFREEGENRWATVF